MRPSRARSKVKTEVNVKGIGQECPIHMGKIPALSLQKTQGRGRGTRFPENLLGMSTKVDSTFVDFTFSHGRGRVE